MTIPLAPFLRLYKLPEASHSGRSGPGPFSRRGQAQDPHTFVDKPSVCLTMVFLISSAWEIGKPSLASGDEVGVKCKLMITCSCLPLTPGLETQAMRKSLWGQYRHIPRSTKKALDTQNSTQVGHLHGDLLAKAVCRSVGLS